MEEDTEKDVYDRMDEALLDNDMTYLPPSSLKLGQETVDRFLALGFKTKWVRIRGRDGIDTKNIRKRMHPSEGFSFVAPEELQDDEMVRIGDVERYGDSPIVTNGDLVLMKVPTKKADARREYYSGMTQQQSDAINARLGKQDISSDSKSSVRTGKNAHFSN